MSKSDIIIIDGASGGFDRQRDPLVVVAAWLWPADEWRVFSRRRFNELKDLMVAARLVCGHNIQTFDIPRIEDLAGPMNLHESRTFDLLAEIRKASDRHGWNLDAVGRATLGIEKHTDGKVEAAMVKAGQLLDVADAAIGDVRLIQRLLVFAVRHGYLKGENDTAKIDVRRLPAEWERFGN